MRLKAWITVVTAGLLGVLVLAPAYAGSFQLNEQDAGSLARAHAGSASDVLNANAIYYNPALLTQLQMPDISAGVTYYDIKGEFSKERAVDVAGQPLTGGNGGNMGKRKGYAPALSFAAPINNRMAWGIALETPFGLSTNYSGTSVLRYQAQETSITVLNLNPTFAYRVTPAFSIGVGIDYARLSAKISNHIDYGAVCYAALGPITCNSLQLYPQSHDGFFQVTGHDYALGWNIGFAWHHANTTIGLAYRSRFFFNLSGDAQFKNTPAIFAAQNVFTDTGAQAKVDLPDMLNLGITQQLNSRWKLSGTIRYTRWSTFHDLAIGFSNPNQPPVNTTYDYRNAWFVSIGADYTVNRAWTLHGGLAYDESPVRDAYRDPRLPDTNRRWAAFGATWTIDHHNRVAIGYAHLFMHDHVPMDHTGPSGSTVIGTWSENANLVSLNYQYRF